MKKFLRETKRVGHFDYSGENYGDEVHDALPKFLENIPDMVVKARWAREKKAKSYRGFLVGACALVNNIDEQKLATYIGWNDSHFRGKPKHCAEMRAFGNAIRDGYTQREAIVVVGPNNPEELRSVNELPTPTLHPCVERCIDLLQDHTVVLTLAGDEDVYEIHTGAQLKAKHRDANKVYKGRRRSNRNQVSMAEPIRDPGLKILADSSQIYELRTPGLVDFESEHALRIARAEALVTAVFETAKLAQ